MNFSMSVADTKKVAEEVIAETKVNSQEYDKLKEQAETNALAVMDCDLGSMEQKKMLVGSIEQFGFDSMHKSSTKNSLLKVSVGNLSKSGEEGGQVSKSLLELNREIKNLDPSLIDFTKTGVLGKVFNPIRNYFDKYQKSEDVIANIINSLDKGKATLKNDNTTLALEEQQLRELTRKIAKEIEMGSLMDECIAAKIGEAQAQAGTILEGSRAESIEFANRTREEAQTQGYKDGHAEGKAQFEALTKDAQQIKAQAEAEYRDLMNGAEADAVELVMDIARKVIGKEMEVNRKNLLIMIKDAFDHCSNKDQAILKVSPDDFEYVNANRDALLTMTDGIGHLEIKADLSMQPGSCQIETPLGNIDAGMETKLSKIEAAFFKVLENQPKTH